eukprot:7944857-Alexandrium_andersonii.AAC.1
MSASLVGSEMCIRDRSAFLKRPVYLLAFEFHVAFTCRPALSAWQQSREPVSYTHLTLPTICSV